MIVGPSTVLNVSSSGLIYAGIVGAWAVYLVPVWLRREEQLNEAREKARYAAAIRTLGRSERFEKKVLAEESLAATGTDGGGGPRAGGSGRGTGRGGGDARDSRGTPGENGRLTGPLSGRKTPGIADADGRGDRDARGAGSERQATSTANADSTHAKGARSAGTGRPKALGAAQARKGISARLPHHESRASAAAAATAARRRGVLLMRRRRVVAFLFTLATFGALVSVVMGLSYSWAMLAPATLFSGYIVYIRRDEKQRARERYRRRQAVLAAQRRQERQERQRQETDQRTAPVAEAVVAEPDTSVWRPMAAPQEYRRAANG